MQVALGLAAGSTLFAPQAFAQEPAATRDAVRSLPAVTVTAKPTTPEDLPPPAPGGQVATGGRLGLMGNVDVMDTPFNVTGYTSKLIEDQQARTLADVLANDPSVRSKTSSGHAYENFRIRGFDVLQNDVSINGMFGLLPVGHVPIEFIERVEVLRGPSALFSGMAPSGGVGGTINLVPKRAEDDPLARLTVGYQSESQLITNVDVGRRFGEDKSLGLRINGAFSNGDTDLDGQAKKREFISGALDYRNDTLKASLDAFSSRESYTGGTPAMFWFAGKTIPGAPDPAVNQFPSARGTLDSKGAIARGEYAFNPHITAFAGAGFMNNVYSGFINASFVRDIDDQGASRNTRTIGQRGYYDNVSAEAGVRARFNTGGVAHEMVVQVSNLEQESGSAFRSSSVYATNIYDPIFKDIPSIPARVPKTSESTLTSVALVDTLSFMADTVRLTAGLRNQTVKTSNFNAVGRLTQSYDESVVTPAVALVVKPWGPDISLYANYVQGLSKGDSVSTPTYAFDYTFAPYKTEQKELGVKWNAAGFGNTLALFEITKPMLITLSGNVPSDGGETRMRGIEWNTSGEVVRGVRLLGGVAYNEGTQTKTAYDRYNGNEAIGAPRWQGNLGLEWDPACLTGLTLSGRVIATSGQYLNAANTLRIPGWSEFEIGARYAMQVASKRLVWRLNIANLFDRHYYSGVFGSTTPIATLGQGRTVTASVAIDL
ncbi:MAG: TonB-dependent siderophore receptor [Rhodocyclaceae bacterium]